MSTTTDYRCGKIFFDGRASSLRMWLVPFEATKSGTYKVHLVTWDTGARKPGKSKQSGGWTHRAMNQDVREVTRAEVPAEVLARFIDAGVLSPS